MTRTDYEQIAGVFDRRYQGGRYAGAEQVVLDLLGPSRGRRALEVGCGTGHWLELLHENGFEVTGLDASPGMLEQARARLPSATLVHGSAEQLPFPDAGPGLPGVDHRARMSSEYPPSTRAVKS